MNAKKRMLNNNHQQEINEQLCAICVYEYDTHTHTHTYVFV